MPNIITKAIDAIRGFGQKAATFSTDTWQGVRRRLSYNFGWGTAQGYAGNSLVYACIDARASALASVAPEVRTKSPDGKGEVLQDHPLTELLENPNPFYSWEEFIYLSEVYRLVSGDAYWWKGRNRAGAVVELWAIRPDWVQIKANPNSNDFISYYEYNHDGLRVNIPVQDMVHHRRGVNPIDPQHGLAPLAAVMAEIGLDGMATEHVTALLDNYAIPPIHVKVKRKLMNQAEADEIKRRMMSRMGGPRRGEPLVSDQDTEIAIVTTTPQQMELPDLRRISESRICAVFNVPPIVVGALVGLEHGTYSNYGQAREAFWDECVGASLREYKGKIRKDLQRADFDDRSVFGWNLSDVRALQEDEEKKRRFYLDSAKAGLITRGQFLDAIGMDKDSALDADYYLVPTNATERQEGEFPDPPAPPVALPPPTPLRQLPAPTGTDGNTLPKADTPAMRRKADAAARLPGFVLRLRESMIPTMQAELEQWFIRLGARVERRAREQTADHTDAERASDGTTRIDLDVSRLIIAKDIADLALVFGRYYTQFLELSWDEISETIGTHQPFTIEDPIVQSFAARSASRVVDIAETTRDVLADSIAKAQAGGYGVDDLIRGVFDRDTGAAIVQPIRETVSGRGLYPGIYQREYDAQIGRGKTPQQAHTAAERKASNYRALNIARTELGYAANAGATVRYAESGFVLAVRVHDGDGCGWRSHDDPDKANGTIRTLQEAELYTLAHPSCQRAFSPVVDPADLPQDWGQQSA